VGGKRRSKRPKRRSEGTRKGVARDRRRRRWSFAERIPAGGNAGERTQSAHRSERERGEGGAKKRRRRVRPYKGTGEAARGRDLMGIAREEEASGKLLSRERNAQRGAASSEGGVDRRVGNQGKKRGYLRLGVLLKRQQSAEYQNSGGK